MNTKRSNMTLMATIGGIILLVLLVGGIILLGRRTRTDTEDAVHSVSRMFLYELADRREQVVEENLRDRIYDLEVALELMTEEDLQDTEHLQAYQARMKRIYTLEKFAFVDTDGLIYTSKGNQTNIDDYHFDYETISGPEISILNLASPDKKVIIAVPLDHLPFMGKEFVACFMEIDMEEMLSGLSLTSNNEGITFCNIYTEDGVALTNTVLGGLAMEDNLLEAMSHADYEAGYSYEKVTDDFAGGKAGEVSFVYNDINETLSYVPIEGTNWFLTYLLRESVLSSQIGSITDGILKHSFIYSLLIAAVLVFMFAYILIQTRRNARLLVEKETSEAESRVKQQNLEQQLALQNQLLEQEKMRAQQDNMITALSSDYRSVYYVDLDEDDAVCYLADKKSGEAPAEGEHFPYLKDFTDFGSKHVAESYREGYFSFIQPDNIRSELLRQPVIAYRFLEIRGDGTEVYTMLRIAGVRHMDERSDTGIHEIGVGFTNIDEEMRKSMDQQDALASALAAAEEANKAKTAFLSNMSHEIRTPMNAIIGLDSLALRNPALPEETREYLDKIGGSARHLLGLINDILDMSRIESGRMVLQKEEFSFRDMLEQINTMVMSQCNEKGLKYECSLLGGVSDYYIGDDMKLKQVLINILSNAIKFTDAPGSVTLSVERTATYEDQSTLKFVVKDTGIGMDPSFIPKIFDSFTQEDSSRNNKYGSTGLGMAITKNIVTLMNGTISVQSEKGVGTAFTVIIPLKNCVHNGLAINYIKPKDMRVLVVDDEEIAAEHARMILDEVGIKADACFSGEEALGMMEIMHTKHTPYNLVLLDWKMPEMDGLQVTQEIRKRYSKETTVIILTSYNWDDIIDEALHIGVDSFLAKPLFASNVISEFERIARKNNMHLFREKQRAELKDRRILLAEDIVINAEIMKELIRSKEAQIDHGENGKIVLDMFEKSSLGYYDAILMDVRMPEMDGLEATSAIRALDRADAKIVPIIALTANAFDEDVQRSLQVGMNAHLSKPVEPDHLFQILEELIWEYDEASSQVFTDIE